MTFRLRLSRDAVRYLQRLDHHRRSASPNASISFSLTRSPRGLANHCVDTPTFGQHASAGGVSSIRSTNSPKP